MEDKVKKFGSIFEKIKKKEVQNLAQKKKEKMKQFNMTNIFKGKPKLSKANM